MICEALGPESTPVVRSNLVERVHEVTKGVGFDFGGTALAAVKHVYKVIKRFLALTLLANDRENTGKALRVFVEGGGCSGMQYSMVFDDKREDDFSAEFHGVFVLVDPFSANYLRGSVIDFVDELNGGGFKISNPNARHSCGCGKSFEA